MNKRTKNLEKGITLIALIITIIVLLILAGVSILMLTGENGILNQAVKAREQTDIKNAEEQVKLAIMGSYGQDGKISLSDLKSNLSKIEGITGLPTGDITSFPLTVTIDGKQIELNMNEDGTVTAEAKVETNPSTPEEPTIYEEYNIGEEVIVDEESFYVLEASDSSTATVTLLAKFNLNLEGIAQSNETYSRTACVFSNTAYWLDIDGITYPYNLNGVTTDVSTDAINKAKNYAISKGATNGRLLTYEEANSLKGSYENMIFGQEASDGYLYYWLGSAYYSDVWTVIGSSKNLDSFGHGSSNYGGVRPVIEISKSLVQ